MSEEERNKAIVSMLIRSLRDAVIAESDESSRMRERQLAWKALEYAINQFIRVVVRREEP